MDSKATAPVEKTMDLTSRASSAQQGTWQQIVTDENTIAEQQVGRGGNVGDAEWRVASEAKAALEGAQDSLARIKALSRTPMETLVIETLVIQDADAIILPVDKGLAHDNAAGDNAIPNRDAMQSNAYSMEAKGDTMEIGDSEADSLTRVAGVTVKLALDFSASGAVGSVARGAFERDLCQDLANASGVLAPSHFSIVDVSPGSVVVQVMILSTIKGPDPFDVAAELELQAADSESPLRSGVITRFTQSFTQSAVPKLSQVEPALATTTFETKCATLPILISSAVTLKFPDASKQTGMTQLLPEEPLSEQGSQSAIHGTAVAAAILNDTVAAAVSAPDLARSAFFHDCVVAEASAAESDKHPESEKPKHNILEDPVVSPENGPDVVDLSANLEQQAADPDSQLHAGKITRACVAKSIADNHRSLEEYLDVSTATGKAPDEAEAESTAQKTGLVSTAAAIVDRIVDGTEVVSPEDAVTEKAPCSTNEESIETATRDLVKSLQTQHHDILKPLSPSACDAAESADARADNQNTAHQPRTLYEAAKRNVCATLRPLPKSSRSTKKSKQGLQDTSQLTLPCGGIQNARGAHKKVADMCAKGKEMSSSTYTPSPAQLEVRLLRESHSTLLQRVQMLEAALQAVPTTISQFSATNRDKRAMVVEADPAVFSACRLARFDEPSHEHGVASQLPPIRSHMPQLVTSESQLSEVQQPLVSREYRLLSDEYMSRMGAGGSLISLDNRDEPLHLASFSSRSEMHVRPHCESERVGGSQFATRLQVLAVQHASDGEQEDLEDRRNMLNSDFLSQNKHAAHLLRAASCTREKEHHNEMHHKMQQGGSPNSNGHVHTPRSVGSLPSCVPSTARSLLSDVGAGFSHLAAAGHVVTVTEGSQRHLDHDSRLALRAERYRPASPIRRGDSVVQKTCHRQGSYTRASAHVAAHLEECCEQEVAQHSQDIAAVEPAWWELKEPEQSREQSTESGVASAWGRRLLPWEREVRREVRVCDEQVSLAIIEQEKEAIIKIQCLARGNKDRQVVKDMKHHMREAAVQGDDIPHQRGPLRARVLDQKARKMNFEAELVGDLMAKGGVVAGSMGLEEQWLAHLKVSFSHSNSQDVDARQDMHAPSAQAANPSRMAVSDSMSMVAGVTDGGGGNGEGLVELEAVYGCVGASGKALCHLTASQHAVFAAGGACVVVSPDGQHQRLFTHHTLHTHQVTCLSMHSNGRLIASASCANPTTPTATAVPSGNSRVEIILWDSVTMTRCGAPLYPGHSSSVGHMCFSQTAHTAQASASGVPAHTLLSTPSTSYSRTHAHIVPHPLPRTHSSTGPLHKRSFSPQKSRGVEDTGLCASFATASVQRGGGDPFLRNGSWAEGGQYLVSIGTDTFHSIILWDLASCCKVCLVYGARDPINAVTFAADNTTLVTCATSHIKFWTLPSADHASSALIPTPSHTPWSHLKGRASAPLRAGGRGGGGGGPGGGCH